MILENDFLKVELGSIGFPKLYTYKPAEQSLCGYSDDDKIGINQEQFELSSFIVLQSGNVYTVSHPSGYSFSVTVNLNNSCIEYKIEQAKDSKDITTIDLNRFTLLNFDESYHYARDYFIRNQWFAEMGRGLSGARYEVGEVIAAFPDSQGSVSVHACGFKEDMCAYVTTDYAVMPLYTRHAPHSSLAYRSKSFLLGINRCVLRINNKPIKPFTFKIAFTGDINGDGIANDCDYQLALREELPKPNPIYKDASWYKIMCAANGAVTTTFTDALDIIKAIHKMTNGRKQIVYLVGWQYTGHDSGYPSFDKVNEQLGSVDELIAIIKEAKEKYNCALSLHINVDDAYTDNPGYDESLISCDVNGKPMTWERFYDKQAYHINHTKDVESGSIFKRLDALLNLLPIDESIHIDAFRNTNYSWESDRFIGPDEELYCGMLPIIKYLSDRNIDVTTEALNGMVVEPSAVFSGLWHNFRHLPVLYHNIIYGGARGYNPISVIIGSALNDDYTRDKLHATNDILEQIAMHHLLYKYLLTLNMVNYTTNGLSATVWYDNGTVGYASEYPQVVELVCDGTVIADNQTRFIPLDDGIYVYSTTGGMLKRRLPEGYRNAKLDLCVQYGKQEILSSFVNGDSIYIDMPKETLIRITKTGHKDR